MMVKSITGGQLAAVLMDQYKDMVLTDTDLEIIIEMYGGGR